MTTEPKNELPGLKDAQKALAHELMNAGFSDAADYMMGDYMKAVMAEKLQPRPAKAVQGGKAEALTEIRQLWEDQSWPSIGYFVHGQAKMDIAKLLEIIDGE